MACMRSGFIRPPRVPHRSKQPTSVAQPEGLVKVNVDASLCDEGCVGLGAIARDHRGNVLFSVVRRTKA